MINCVKVELTRGEMNERTLEVVLNRAGMVFGESAKISDLRLFPHELEFLSLLQSTINDNEHNFSKSK